MGLTKPPGLERRRLPVLGLTGALPLAVTHGVLMTLGFLGTLIALERAVALGRGWG